MSPVAIAAIVMGSILLVGSLFIVVALWAASFLGFSDLESSAAEDLTECEQELNALKFELDRVDRYDRVTLEGFDASLRQIDLDYQMVRIDELSPSCLRAAVAFEEVYLHHQESYERWEECGATGTCDVAAWEADELPARWDEARELLDEADRLLDVAD